MILIAEPVHFGDTHLQVNSALLALFVASCPHQEIVFFAEEHHCIAVLKVLSEHFIKAPQTVSFRNYNPRNNFSWWKKITGEIIQVKQILKKAKVQNPDILVWTSLFPTGHLAMILLKKLICPRQKQIVLLHGELEYFNMTTRKKSDQWLRKLLLIATKHSDSATSYWVMGHQIFERIRKTNHLLARKTYVQPHPFLYRVLQNKNSAQSTPLRLCLFGAQSQRYFDQLQQLALGLKTYIEQGTVEISIIGGYPTESMLESKLLNWIYPGEFLQQEVLKQILANQDIALFLYAKEQYSLSASGALHEALNSGLSIYALRNHYFSEVLSDFKIGSLAENEQEMLVQIKELIVHKDSLLTQYRQQIIMYLQQNSFLLQSEKLKDNLQRIGFAGF